MPTARRSRSTIAQGTAEALAESGAQFDIVLALEIVEHVADVDLFLRSCGRLVKPGGLLFLSTLNRTAKAWALAIAGAEYVLGWLPRGTHDWRKFLKPSEVVNGLRAGGIEAQEIVGVVYSPLSRAWSLNKSDLDVNYMLYGSKRHPDGRDQLPRGNPGQAAELDAFVGQRLGLLLAGLAVDAALVALAVVDLARFLGELVADMLAVLLDLGAHLEQRLAQLLGHVPGQRRHLLLLPARRGRSAPAPSAAGFSTSTFLPPLPSRGAMSARSTLASPHTAQPIRDFFS